MPATIGQYVLKVHGRCDLACDHCYVYEHADQSWRGKPARISPRVARKAVERIAEHVVAHRIDTVQIILHGGEPLLLGHAGMAQLLGTLRSGLDPVTRLNLHLHTNGVRLDARFCAIFTEYEVKVGVSLDGDRVANDRHRTYRDGRSSHAGVLRALALLRERRPLYAGILCTIDLANDPIAVYEALIREDPPVLDLLLPQATWDSPPYRPPGVPAPYADWLGRIHDRWTADGRPVPIRLFDSIASAARGGPSWTEAIGLEPVELLVIDTDGAWEQADSLKTAFDGAPATGMDVFTHTVDDVARHTGVAARRTGREGLAATCRACEVVDICGGGLYAHRYRTGTGFDNPSVYCADLKALIGRVTAAESAAAHRLSPDALASLGAGPGTPAALAELAASRLSVNRLLTARVAAASAGDDGDLADVAAEGWALLCELDRTHAGAVGDVLSHPHVEAWATSCLRASPSGRRGLDRAHLAGLAAAAALRAGRTADLELPVRDGLVHLPTVGALRTGDVGPAVRVHVTPGGIAAGHPGVWLPARRIVAGGVALAVEDLDPYRGGGTPAVAGRLTPAGWRAWRSVAGAGLRDLRAGLPEYAGVLGQAVTSVVPLTGGPGGVSAPRAYGAVATALPPGAAEFVEVLIGAFQDTKLDAVGDLHDLCEPRFRPVTDHQRATYRSLGLGELSRARHDAARFRRHRAAVVRGLDALTGSAALTGDGRTFVDGMATTCARWARTDL